ncbi:hypothetical protein JTB14_012532 [Gonioctena quinquepunctata]|nr:hypothetical protein JTB14_012532 [Gonioctena quinquepunctata]
MQECIDLGHMTKINQDSPNCKYIIAQQEVIKEDSLTNELRVVADGSCQTDRGWSLNDLQFCGPEIQNDIFHILCRFRIYTYVTFSNIAKMYRQIQMNPFHRPLQCILWRNSESDPIDMFQ